MNLLFDLDGFVYRAAFSCQKTLRHVRLEEGGDVVSSFDYHKDMKAWLKKQELEQEDVFIDKEIIVEEDYIAKRNAKAIVNTVLEGFPGASVEYYLTGKDNFRDLIYDQYKANRIGVDKPVHHKLVLDYYKELLSPTTVDGMEADDMLAIRATTLGNEGKEWCIVSQDKDLKTVPGLHYDPVKASMEIVDPWTADFYFYGQVLTGDTSDNIPGLYGVGKKKASDMLELCEDERDMYQVCLDAYGERFMGENPIELMHRNCQLLFMLRERGKMWQPPVQWLRV